MEIWQKISGYEKYEVSTFGNIKNIKTNKILAKTLRSGYHRVKLCINFEDKKYKTESIHKLVANTFLTINKLKTQVNHKNGIKTDNNISNLEWVNNSENIIHAQNNGLMKKYKKSVKQYSLDNKFIKEWDSIKEVEKYYKLSHSVIKNNVKKLGFIWKIDDKIDNKIDDKIDINIDDEIWQPFKNTNYFISSYGRVKNKKILTPRIRDNRSEHNLRIDKKCKTFQTHRLVAECFIENNYNLSQVDHIDKNSLNNHISNLRWISAIDNINHSFAKSVNQYTLDDIFIKNWNSMAEIEKELNISHTYISAVCNNRQKSSNGFKWKFAEIK